MRDKWLAVGDRVVLTGEAYGAHGGMDRHAMFFSLIGVLAILVNWKYGTLSPFVTHNAIITIFLVAVLVYVVASACKDKLEAAHSKSIAACANLLAGILAVVMLIIILEPEVGWLLLCLWALLLIRVAYTLREELSQLCKSLHNEVLQARAGLYSAFLEALAGLYSAVPLALAGLYSAFLEACAVLYSAVLLARAGHGMAEFDLPV